MKKIFNILSIFAASTLAFTGCFNLEEEAFSEVVQEQFVQSDQDVAALLASTYSEFGSFFDWYGMFDAQEEPCDDQHSDYTDTDPTFLTDFFHISSTYYS
jgi:hypothetical protein